MKKLKSLGAETDMALPPNSWSSLEENLMTIAVESGGQKDRDDIVRWLLAQGVNPRPRTPPCDFRETSLATAIFHNKIRTINLLLENWERVIFKDEVGAAFEFVCSDADVSMVKLFLKKGIRPKYFNRALLLTILRDKFENFTFLIDEMKMEVNFEFPKYLFGPHDCLYYEKAQDGGTPLALAASRDFDIKTPPVAYVRYLLCRGAKIDENAIKKDSTYFLKAVARALEHIETHGKICVSDRLYSSVEKAAIRTIYLVLHRNKLTGTFRPFSTLLSFISYHGIFMASGFELGSEEDYCDRYMFYDLYDPSSGKVEAID